MKKNIIICVLFFLTTAFTFTLQFQNANYVLYNELSSIGESENSIDIALTANGNSSENVYAALQAVLEKYNGNVYYTQVSSRDGQDIVTKFLYWNDIQAFEGLPLTEGRFFTEEEKEADVFLSTKTTGNAKQIGTIADFTGEYFFEIRTMASNLTEGIFDRKLTVELTDPAQFDAFTADMKEQGYDIANLDTGMDILAGYDQSFLQYIAIAILLLVLMLVIFYDILHSYKKIAIEKMLGYSRFAIWKKRLLQVVLVAIATMLVTTAILIIARFQIYNLLFFEFIGKLLILYALILLLVVLFVTIPFLYTKRISISSMLKNKRPTTAIITFNTLIKIVASTVLLICSFQSFSQAQTLMTRYNNNLSKWESTKEYYVITSLGYRGEFSGTYTKEEYENMQKLYLHFNQKGSIYADFNSFLPSTYESNSEMHSEKYILDDIWVNPNYLKDNPVLDEFGNTVAIEEANENFVLLVPEKYKENEKEIRDWYQPVVSADFYEEQEHDHQEGEADEIVYSDQKVEIIWTQDNQRLFSYRLDIAPDSANCVTDPIVIILTESNGDLSSYFVLAGYMGNPFKIKVDSADAEQEILNQFFEYFDPGRYIFPLVSLYDSIEDQIVDIQNEIAFYAVLLVILLAMIITIILQNLLNYFEENRLRLAIQKFHGYRMIDMYGNYFITTIISWVTVLALSTFVTKSLSVLLLGAIVLLLELAALVVAIRIIEKRKILLVTKGG